MAHSVQALLFALFVLAPIVSAETYAVDTPEGTFYLTDGVDRHTSRFCIWGDVVICMPGPGVPQVDRVAPGEAGVWQETNGCPGLQTSTGYCRSTGENVEADTRMEFEPDTSLE